MKIKILYVLFALLFMINNAIGQESTTNLSADEALEKLQKGNERFVKMKLKHPDSTKKRRIEMLRGQHPFVAILSCSDSRVPPELIFDQGLGDIFEIRNAGNVLNKHVIGSIEYAVMHCGVKLVVIMGHEDCGAVNATLSKVKETEFIQSLEDSIEPAVKKCRVKGLDVTPDNVVKEHVVQDIEELLEQDSNLVNYMKENDVKIIPAYYNLSTGIVDFL